jgi:glycosyltransferase involved in cell wall biosynthesis
VNLLLIPASYPYPGAEWIGAQNEHCALALHKVVNQLEILTPRPYAPRWLAFNDRWRAYTQLPDQQVRRDLRVHRPMYPVVPRIFQAFWPTKAAFLFSRRLAKALHHKIDFDAILSFDLALTGGLAWRLGRELGLPACGWATGSDIRWSARSAIGRSVREALQRLDIVFYQSGELKALGAELLGVRQPDDLPSGRHLVQSRGVVEPEALPADGVRSAVRSGLQISDEQILILYLGRIARGKGLFELVDGFRRFAKSRGNVVLLLVGAIPGRDDAAELEQKVQTLSHDDGRIVILPACAPARIWDYFTAADIFVFPSFREGMPNSLLEAMLAGLPAVAFSIPAVHDITRFGKGLVEVEAYDFSSFWKAVGELASEPSRRREIGARARAIVHDHFSLQENMRNVVGHIGRLTAR